MKLVKLVKLFEKHMCLILSFVLVCILSVSLANSGMLPEHFEGEDNVPTCCLFHADWCPHCTKFLPDWNKFKQTHGSKCKIVDIEAKDKETMKKHGISGYPTIKFLPNGLSNPEGAKEYDGERNIDSLAKFVDENVTEKFTEFLANGGKETSEDVVDKEDDDENVGPTQHDGSTQNVAQNETGISAFDGKW